LIASVALRVNTISDAGAPMNRPIVSRADS